MQPPPLPKPPTRKAWIAKAAVGAVATPFLMAACGKFFPNRGSLFIYPILLGVAFRITRPFCAGGLISILGIVGYLLVAEFRH